MAGVSRPDAADEIDVGSMSDARMPRTCSSELSGTSGSRPASDAASEHEEPVSWLQHDERSATALEEPVSWLGHDD